MRASAGRVLGVPLGNQYFSGHPPTKVRPIQPLVTTAKSRCKSRSWHHFELGEHSARVCRQSFGGTSGEPIFFRTSTDQSEADTPLVTTAKSRCKSRSWHHFELGEHSARVCRQSFGGTSGEPIFFRTSTDQSEADTPLVTTAKGRCKSRSWHHFELGEHSARVCRQSFGGTSGEPIFFRTSTDQSEADTPLVTTAKGRCKSRSWHHFELGEHSARVCRQSFGGTSGEPIFFRTSTDQSEADTPLVTTAKGRCKSRSWHHFELGEHSARVCRQSFGGTSGEPIFFRTSTDQSEADTPLVTTAKSRCKSRSWHHFELGEHSARVCRQSFGGTSGEPIFFRTSTDQSEADTPLVTTAKGRCKSRSWHHFELGEHSARVCMQSFGGTSGEPIFFRTSTDQSEADTPLVTTAKGRCKSRSWHHFELGEHSARVCRQSFGGTSGEPIFFRTSTDQSEADTPLVTTAKGRCKSRSWHHFELGEHSARVCRQSFGGTSGEPIFFRTSTDQSEADTPLVTTAKSRCKSRSWHHFELGEHSARVCRQSFGGTSGEPIFFRTSTDQSEADTPLVTTAKGRCKSRSWHHFELGEHSARVCRQSFGGTSGEPIFFRTSTDQSEADTPLVTTAKSRCKSRSWHHFELGEHSARVCRQSFGGTSGEPIFFRTSTDQSEADTPLVTTAKSRCKSRSWHHFELGEHSARVCRQSFGGTSGEPIFFRTSTDQSEADTPLVTTAKGRCKSRSWHHFELGEHSARVCRQSFGGTSGEPIFFRTSTDQSEADTPLVTTAKGRCKSRSWHHFELGEHSARVCRQSFGGTSGEPIFFRTSTDQSEADTATCHHCQRSLQIEILASF